MCAPQIDVYAIWTKWEMSGTCPDGHRHAMGGVIIFNVLEKRASWSGFYIEAVDPGVGGVDAAASQTVDAEPGA